LTHIMETLRHSNFMLVLEHTILSTFIIIIIIINNIIMINISIIIFIISL